MHLLLERGASVTCKNQVASLPLHAHLVLHVPLCLPC